jgi:hypothetical protein
MHQRTLSDILKAQQEFRETKSAVSQSNIWRIIMNNRITKLAIATAIVIILLVPLSYGTSHLIKKLFVGSVEVDDYQGDFALSRDISIELEVGTKKQQNIIWARNIRFFTEEGELRGTLRCGICCLPKYKWMTTIELFDVQDKKLASTEHVNENAGVEVSHQNSSPRDIHFSLGRWSNVSQAQKFRVCFEKVSEDIETTPDAWIESSELDVVHGRVTGTDGKPVANAVIQIREKRKPGQSSIAAPDVITDKQGFYSYDEIKWPYRVGVLIQESHPYGQRYKHYYKRLNKTIEGSQTVDFVIGKVPAGSAAIYGKAENPDGRAIKEFTVDVQLKVDYKDYSPKYLLQYGYRKSFTTEDGKFEISGLPAGVYNVTIYPTKNEILEVKDYVGRMSYVCELQESQKIEVGAENARGKILYGRVLFEDGTPAVPDLEGFETQVILWGQDYTTGLTIAIVDNDGYFTFQRPDEDMEQLKSGKTWLTVGISKPDINHEVQKDERISVDLLSSEREKVGVIKIHRPNIYYGRILYENGKPAVPEVLPWPGAKVWAILRYTPATSKAGGLTEHLSDVDKDGYFSAYFTDEQIEKIKAEKYSIQIYHPSHELMRASYPIVNYPFEMLSTEKNNVKGYKLSSEDIIAPELKDINNILESIEKLKELFAARKTYANDHHGNYPGTIGLLDIKADDFQWLAENVEYIADAKAQTTSKPAETVLAYDKALLKKYGSTLVLFRDGHIEFCWPRQLEILGISIADVEALP